jgi:hypothetical protein
MGANMGVKHLICKRENLLPLIEHLLREGYDNLKIFLPGTGEHQSHGLAGDMVLIRAWRERRS